MTVAVIGAGLQGSLAAIELARRGHDVMLFERGEEPLGGASRWNEGKLHLGYLFANDPSLRSARTMIDGATRFAPLLTSYLERDLDFLGRSDGFVYAVHRESLLAADEVAAHLGRTHDLVRDALAERGRNYLGERHLAAPEPRNGEGLDRSRVVAAFNTGERSMDARALVAAVAERLGHEPLIRLETRSEISAVRREANGTFSLACADGTPHGPFRHIVNATWEQRLGLDETLGYTPQVPWMHRYKLALHVAVEDPRHAGVPSVTIVLGPFGDVVNFGGRQLYLSWYPVGRIASSVALVPPRMDEQLEAARRDGVASSIAHHLAEIVPALGGLKMSGDSSQLNGGYIFAWGGTDISDKRSGLHNRYDIGIHSDRGYHSIDTGKLTMAPLNAARLGERVGNAPSRRAALAVRDAASQG